MAWRRGAVDVRMRRRWRPSARGRWKRPRRGCGAASGGRRPTSTRWTICGAWWRKWSARTAGTWRSTRCWSWTRPPSPNRAGTPPASRATTAGPWGSAPTARLGCSSATPVPRATWGSTGCCTCPTSGPTLGRAVSRLASRTRCRSASSRQCPAGSSRPLRGHRRPARERRPRHTGRCRTATG